MRSGMWLRHVFAHHVRACRRLPLSSTRSSSIEFRSITQCSPLTRCAYGFSAGPVLDPGVRPAEPPVAVLRRRHRVAVGPGVHEHQVDVGDAALGQGGNDVGMGAQQLVALDELVDGEVGLHSGNVLERLDAIVGQRHHALVGGVGRPLQADHVGAPRWRRSPVVERAQLGLARFGQLDRREPPSVSHAVLALQDRRDRPELVAAERIQWVSHAITQSHPLTPRSDSEFGDGLSARPARSLPRPAGGRRAGRIRRGAAGRTPSPRGRRWCRPASPRRARRCG